jgi:S1-C subfamily serine protease
VLVQDICFFSNKLSNVREKGVTLVSSSNLKVILAFVVSAVAVTIIIALLFPHHPMADLLRSSLQKPTATITPSPQEPNKIEATQNPDAYVGIGLEGFPIVNKLMIGKPAHKAGIQVDDVVEQIDGISIEGLSSEDIIATILGEVGTTVVLTVHRPSTNQNLTIPVLAQSGKITPKFATGLTARLLILSKTNILR